jgi:hypothetical protein
MEVIRTQQQREKEEKPLLIFQAKVWMGLCVSELVEADTRSLGPSSRAQPNLEKPEDSWLMCPPNPTGHTNLSKAQDAPRE